MKLEEIKEDKSAVYYDDWNWSIVYVDDYWTEYNAMGAVVYRYSDFLEALSHLYPYKDEIKLKKISIDKEKDWMIETHYDKTHVQHRYLISPKKKHTVDEDIDYNKR